jgi:hypothetical protein
MTTHDDAMKTHSSLLALPRELHDIIYHYLLQGTYRFTAGRLLITATHGYVEDDSEQSFLGLWMLACKQIMAEAQEYFHWHAVCVRCVDSAALNAPTGLVELQHFRKIALCNGYMESLVFSHHATQPETLDLEVCVRHRTHTLSLLADYLRSSDNKLKDLTIRFALRVMGPIPTHVKVDLGFLEDVASLDRVEFILEEPEIDSCRGELVKFARVYRALQIELLRVGMSLVTTGRSGSSEDTRAKNCVVKDWLDEERFEEATADDGIYWFEEHCWHIECRRSDSIAPPMTPRLQYEGLHCWLAMANNSSGEMRHFRRVRDEHEEKVSWHCEASRETRSVSYQI